MKPDLSLFKELNDTAGFREWWHQLVTVCNGTGLGNTLNFAYVPPAGEVLDFQNRCKWLYTILFNKVKTPEGKEIIEKHKGTCDGRQALYDLQMDARSSMSAENTADDILDKLQTTVLDNTWTKSVLSFVIAYSQALEKYNDTVRFAAQKLTPEMKRSMLERAISKSRSLRDIRNREAHRLAEGHPRLQYHEYLYLVRETAKVIDKERGQPSRRPRRTANVHEWDASGDHDDDFGESEGPDFMAMYAGQTPGSRMDRDTWKSLSNDTQKVWDSIDSKDKAAILNYAQARADKGSTKEEKAPRTPRRPRQKRDINVHDVTGGGDSDDDPEDSDDGGPTMEANVTEVKSKSELNDIKGSAHPGDIRRVLGKKDQESKDRPTRSVNNVTWNVSSIRVKPSGESPMAVGDTSRGSELSEWGVPAKATRKGEQKSELNSFGEKPMVPPVDLDSYWKETDDQFFG